MVKNRVQATLVFSDDEVFENLVLPMKEQKKFSDFIIRLVTKYYRSDTMQDIMENRVPDTTSDEPSEKDNLYAEINESIAAMEFFMEQGRQELEEGADIFTEILTGAEKSGVMRETNDKDLGKGFSKLNKELLALPDKGTEPIEEPRHSDTEYESMRSEIESLRTTVSSIQGMLEQLLGQGSALANTGVAQLEKSNIESVKPIASAVTGVQSKPAPVVAEKPSAPEPVAVPESVSNVIGLSLDEDDMGGVGNDDDPDGGNAQDDLLSLMASLG